MLPWHVLLYSVLLYSALAWIVTVVCLVVLIAPKQTAQSEHVDVFQSDDSEKSACGFQAQNYPHVSDTEWGERCVARMFTPHDAKVIELGGGAGSVSAVIQERLSDKSKHIVVQPKHEQEMFGGWAALVETKNKLACEFTIVDHELQPGEVNRLTQGTWNPTVLVADCENCLVNEYHKNPEMFHDLKMIQVERDDADQAYTPCCLKSSPCKKYTQVKDVTVRAPPKCGSSDLKVKLSYFVSQSTS